MKERSFQSRVTASYALHLAGFYAFQLSMDAKHSGISYSNTSVFTTVRDWISTQQASALVPNFLLPELESVLRVPEPASLALLASGLSLLALANRRLRR